MSSNCILNLTPLQVTVCDLKGEVLITIPPSGQVARVTTSTDNVGWANGGPHPFDGETIEVPITRVAFGEVVGLPKPDHGVVYLVSLLVRMAVPHRSDVMSPGELIRDTAGQPVGCKGLVMN